MATDEEVAAARLVAGSASPVGLQGIRRVADPSIQLGANFLAGANKPDVHLRNVNYPRDFEVDLLTDIALVQPGQGCPNCGAPMEAARGIEVGHIFKLGSFFSEALGAQYLDQAGQLRPMLMGCYGIGVGRLLAAAIEQNHDDKGIVFPAPIAPYQVHLVGLNLSDPEVFSAADALYQQLWDAGLETLFDDRIDESAGVKLNDADLMGLPVRLVVSPRNLRSGMVELKGRADSEATMVPAGEVLQQAREHLNHNR